MDVPLFSADDAEERVGEHGIGDPTQLPQHHRFRRATTSVLGKNRGRVRSGPDSKAAEIGTPTGPPIVARGGGGSQNTLLSQPRADRNGRTVFAGPVEATIIGNALIQARAQGLVTGSLESLRASPRTAMDPER